MLLQRFQRIPQKHAGLITAWGSIWASPLAELLRLPTAEERILFCVMFLLNKIRSGLGLWATHELMGGGKDEIN